MEGEREGRSVREGEREEEGEYTLIYSTVGGAAPGEEGLTVSFS